jgi:hypothetical protein
MPALTNHWRKFTFCSDMPDDIATLTQPLHSDAPACAEAADKDWARGLLERQLGMLGRLAEGGLEIAQAIERAATDEGSDAAVLADAPLAYARVARAVRLTIMLQSKVIADLQKLESNAEIDASHAKIRQDVARPGLLRERKARIQRIVGRIAWAEGEDADQIEQVMRETGEHLDQDDIYGDVLSRPVSELVALICQDLGLKPDWPALAEHAWAQAEIASGAAGAPLAAVMGRAADTRRPAAAAAEPIPLSPRAASP